MLFSSEGIAYFEYEKEIFDSDEETIENELNEK